MYPKVGERNEQWKKRKKDEDDKGWIPHLHHIIPLKFGNKYLNTVKTLNEAYESEGGFKFNSGPNGVSLPGRIHGGRHGGDGWYMEKINKDLQRLFKTKDFKWAKDNPLEQRKLIEKELTEIRKKILNGNEDYKLNKTQWTGNNKKANKKFFDAMRESLDDYK